MIAKRSSNLLFLLGLLLFGLWRSGQVKCQRGLVCHCHNSVAVDDCEIEARCGPDNVGACFVERDLISVNGILRDALARDCFYGAPDVVEEGCAKDNIECCFTDFCNNFTLPPILTTSAPTTEAPTLNTTTGNPHGVYRTVTIAVPVASALLVLLIILATFLVLFLLRKRKVRIEHLRSERRQMNGGGANDREPSPIFSPYSLDTLDLEDMSCTSGSGSGEPLLTQRTIARSIVIGESIGSGRFGQVFVGEFQGEKVAVKKFASRDEQSWFRESEIYNTVLLRHDNILGFIACDIFSDNGVTELWLVTQYCPYGSLFDYLNLHSVSPKIMMRMVISVCKGLTHLHTEFSGTSAKPAIAHRDIKSKNILVKNSRECCIADFGLAVLKGSQSSLNLPKNPKQGTKRYMAPEILAETIDLGNFESFKQADIYAFGLVLWEICKRCGDKNDSVGDYEPPFHGMVGPDPSFEEMRKLVVEEKRLPAIPRHWQNDDLLQGLTSVMRECWYFDSDARNNMLFYKVKLMKLAKEDKIEYDVQE